MKSVSILKLKLVREGSIPYQDMSIDCPDNANTVFSVMLQDEVQEVFAMIAMDTKHHMIGYFEVHRGTINMSLVSVAEVAKRALMSNAQKVIIGHNHPSGNTTPSEDDIKVTRALFKGLKTLQIDLIDSLIIGDKSYKSLRYVIDQERLED